MKKILQEFKTFALKGSVVDLSVGVIIGASFNKIINSLVSDIIMPPIGLLLGKVNFENLYINLGSQKYGSLSLAKDAGALTINYGLFINAFIGFLITAVAVFFLIKLINRLKSQEEKEPQSTETSKLCPFCLNQVSLKASKCQFCTSELKTG